MAATVAFLDRHPVLKRAVANQYQALLLGGAAAFSLLFANPLPLVLLAGAEMMALPFVLERLKRRIEIEKKYAARTSQAMSLDQRLEELPPSARSALPPRRAVQEDRGQLPRSLRRARGCSPSRPRNSTPSWPLACGGCGCCASTTR
jgi:hypothetical protein